MEDPWKTHPKYTRMDCQRTLTEDPAIIRNMRISGLRTCHFSRQDRALLYCACGGDQILPPLVGTPDGSALPDPTDPETPGSQVSRGELPQRSIGSHEGFISIHVSLCQPLWYSLGRRCTLFLSESSVRQKAPCRVQSGHLELLVCPSWTPSEAHRTTSCICKAGGFSSIRHTHTDVVLCLGFVMQDGYAWIWVSFLNVK